MRSNYIDPGLLTNSLGSSNTNPWDYSPAGEYAKSAGNWWLDNVAQELPPDPWSSSKNDWNEYIDRSTDRLLPDPTMGTAGTIRMGGKVYPNAMLHRAESNPDAIDWWGKVFQRGKTTQKPTSLVSPNMLPTFSSEPYGLLFNVNNEKSIINRAFPEDVWSDRRVHKPGDRAMERLQKTHDTIWNEVRKAFPSPNMVTKPEEYWKMEKYLWDSNVHKYDKAMAKLRSEPLLEKWEPGVVDKNDFMWRKGQRFEDIYPPGSVPDLDMLTSLQKNIVEQKLTKHRPESKWIDHAEIIPDIDPSMLAGVRIPMFNRGESGASDELIHKLLNLAEDRKVPVYRWDADLTLGQQLKGLQDPFAGKWGTVPGTDYKTSSRLPQYWENIRSTNDLPKYADPIDYGSGPGSFSGWDY